MSVIPNTLAQENRHAVQIAIGGNGSAIDPNAYWQLKQLIGSNVSRGVLDKLIVYKYGIDGGFSGCVEESPTKAAPSAAFEGFVKQLGNIHPNAGTALLYKRTLTCPPLKTVVKQNDSSIPIAGFVCVGFRCRSTQSTS